MHESVALVASDPSFAQSRPQRVDGPCRNRGSRRRPLSPCSPRGQRRLLSPRRVERKKSTSGSHRETVTTSGWSRAKMRPCTCEGGGCHSANRSGPRRTTPESSLLCSEITAWSCNSVCSSIQWSVGLYCLWGYVYRPLLVLVNLVLIRKFSLALGNVFSATRFDLSFQQHDLIWY